MLRSMATAKEEPSPPNQDVVSVEALLSLLECPVCLEQYVPPIYTCRIGHAICKECAPSVYRCPICRSGYLGARDFIGEALYSKLEQLGMINKSDVDDQNYVSTSKPIECHIGSLSETMRMDCALGTQQSISDFASYIEHLKLRHKVCNENVELNSTFVKRFYYRNSQNSTFIRNGPSKLIILNCANHSFLVSLHQDGQDVYVFVSTESEKIAKQFQVEIKVPHGTLENENVATWKGKLFDMNKSAKEIFESKACLIVNASNLFLGIRRMRKVAAWVLNITIGRRMLEEATQNSSQSSSLEDEILQVRSQFQSMTLDDAGQRIGSAFNLSRTPEGGFAGVLHSGAEGSHLDRSGRSRLIRPRALLRSSRGLMDFDLVSGEHEREMRESGTSDSANFIRSPGRLERPHSSYGIGRPEIWTRDRAPRDSDIRRRPFSSVLDEARRRRLLRRAPGGVSVVTARDYCLDSDDENAVMERLAREIPGGSPSSEREEQQRDTTDDSESSDESASISNALRRFRESGARESATRNVPATAEAEPAPSGIQESRNEGSSRDSNPNTLRRARSPIFRNRESREFTSPDDPGCKIS